MLEYSDNVVRPNVEETRDRYSPGFSVLAAYGLLLVSKYRWEPWGAVVYVAVFLVGHV